MFTEDSIRNSPNMYDAASPSVSDSDYEETLSPSVGLMQAVKQASTKRSYSQWQTSTINFADFDAGEPPKKRAMTESQAIVEYSSLLYSNTNLKNEQMERPAFFVPVNEDSGIDVNQNYRISSTVNSSSDQPYLSLDDDNLASKFSVLAEYLITETASGNSASEEATTTKAGRLPENIAFHNESNINEVQIQPSEFQRNADSTPPTSLMVTQWLSDLLQQKTPAKTETVQQSETVDSSRKEMNLNKSSLLADICKATSGNVVFFNLSSKKETAVKQTSQNNVASKPSTLEESSDPLELIRKWKGASRSKRSNLFSHSSKPRLYNFLLELLADSNSKCIEWLNEEQGIFKFINSAEVASLWGQRKNKPNMKYENFARSLRTYVAKGILTKPRNKLVYQFMPNYH